MDAVHINSTAPFFARGGKDYRIDACELYCTALSALSWRKFNGSIYLCCDEIAAGYYRRIGLEPLWSGIREIIPRGCEGIDPLMFWAAGKLLALRETEAPVVMLDTDFVVWKQMSFGENLIAAHREELYPDVYPPFEYFRMNNYRFRSGFNREALPLNTAFLYLPDEDFKQFYVSCAIDFMKSARYSEDNLCYMVFAEQRMLAMCAELVGRKADVLLNKDALFEKQDNYTHLWGAKRALRNDPEKRRSFTNACEERIRTDFPQFAFIADRINEVERAEHPAEK